MNASRPDPTLLAHELHRRLEGEVRFDDGSRALYSTDASNYRQVPIGVVVPKTLEDVETTVAVCRSMGVPILARGGGTSLAGQCCNVAVVLDFSKYLNKVVSLDAEAREMVVLPGTILDDANRAAHRFGLKVGPDPATHDHCTIGGMIGNNSCGMHAQSAGKMEDNVIELDVLTYDGARMTVGETPPEAVSAIVAGGGRQGEIYGHLRRLAEQYGEAIRSRYPDIPRRVSGYNLPDLLPEKGFNVARALVGSESTCVLVLQARIRLVPDPPFKSLLVLAYPSVFEAADHVPDLLPFEPLALEGMDDKLISYMEKKHLYLSDVARLPEGKGWLVVQFGGDTADEADDRARAAMAALQGKPGAPRMKLVDDPKIEKHIWNVREAGLGATAFVPGHADTFEGWEDSAVPVPRLGQYLRDLERLYAKYRFDASLYGHFGQGCVHTRIPFDFRTRQGLDQYMAFMEEATDLCVRYGGSFSGEHGDGQSKALFLPKMFGPELMTAMNQFKAIWDPRGLMNPRKLVRPYRPDENLRLGPAYQPHEPRTHFAFAEDGGSFAHATQRCVGVGKCRRMESDDPADGTMCPSFMATREEQHSTRGRSRLLFEMLSNQGPLGGEWRNQPVKEALDLCLACKGCKGDCPVNVDMATYKAEFLSHYYAGRLRPMAAYSMGLIYWWARIASRWPTLSNLAALVPGVKTLAGIAPQRQLPRFARETFRAWFARHRPANPHAPKVMLWPDTFTNFFHPEAGRDAVYVLEKLGYRVEVPEVSLCCGRPLYDWGMLDTARKLLLRVLDALEPQAQAKTPIVGLEPSCVAVFRDELPNLLHKDARAGRLSKQVLVLSEFIQQHAREAVLPRLAGQAILHGHCHQKAIMKLEDEENLLKRTGLSCSIPEPGCCGMAGSFGFEARHYDLSMRIGERHLLPAVRQAPAETLVVADGFSCRTQIQQGTGRTPVHLASVLARAWRQSESDLPAARSRSRWPLAWTAVGLLVGAWVALRRQRVS